MESYATLKYIKDEEEVEVIRDALLKYCELDTLAMIKIAEQSGHIIREKKGLNYSNHD